MARLDIKPLMWDVIFDVFTDSSGQAWKIRIDDTWEKTGSGSTTFNVSFPPGPHKAIFSPAGGNMSSQDFTVKEVEYVEPKPQPPPPKAPEPAPVKKEPTPALQSDEQPLDRIGTSCQIILKEAFGQRFFKVRHDRRGDLTNYRTDFSVSRSAAQTNPYCFEQPPPPPKTTDEISQELSGLADLVKSALDKIDSLSGAIDEIIAASISEAAAWRSAIDGIWDKLESWLIDRIVGILIKGLDRELEKRS